MLVQIVNKLTWSSSSDDQILLIVYQILNY